MRSDNEKIELMKRREGEGRGMGGIEGSEVKEGFCGACLAVPLALAGASAGAAGRGADSERGEYRKRKKLLMNIGIVSIVASIIIAVYFLCFAKWYICKRRCYSKSTVRHFACCSKGCWSTCCNWNSSNCSSH